MECPICGSDDFDILNSKQKSSKKKITEEYLLKCVDCGHVFKNVVSSKNLNCIGLLFQSRVNL